MSSTENTNTTNTAAPVAASPNSSSSAGASAGQKVRGAFQAAYGIGESIRGNAMDFIDSTFGTERSGHDATVRGQQETAQGVANMEGHHPTGTAPVDPNAPATQTATAAPAVPPTDDMKQAPPQRNVGGNYATYHGTNYGSQI